MRTGILISPCTPSNFARYETFISIPRKLATEKGEKERYRVRPCFRKVSKKVCFFLIMSEIPIRDSIKLYFVIIYCAYTFVRILNNLKDNKKTKSNYYYYKNMW